LWIDFVGDEKIYFLKNEMKKLEDKNIKTMKTSKDKKCLFCFARNVNQIK
jgi:hypothetical protein